MPLAPNKYTHPRRNKKPHILGDRDVRFIVYKTVTDSIIFENEYQIKI